MRSGPRAALWLGPVLLLLVPALSPAECPDAAPLETRSGGVGGTGHLPETGGVGGTGHLPETGGVGGTGQAPAVGGVGGTGQTPEIGGVGGTGRSADATPIGGLGGTGVLGTIRADSADNAILCIAGYRLATSAKTTILASSGGGSEQAIAADSSALRAGGLAWAVGALDGSRFEAEHIELLEAGPVALQQRVEAHALRQVVLELSEVERTGPEGFRAAGLELRASVAMVERSRSGRAMRIRAQRDGEGFRAVRLDVLPARPHLDRGAPQKPIPPTPEPVPAPTPTPLPPRPEPAPNHIAPERAPRSDLGPPTRVVPPKRIVPDRPARPEVPLRPPRPERPARPEKPDLPPRPAIDRVGGAANR